MSKFSGSQTLGSIVSVMPKASDIFKEYRIDFGVQDDIRVTL